MYNKPFSPDEADEVFNYITGGEGYISDGASEKLYCYLQPEMPYGVQKARTATPEEWYPEYFYGWDLETIQQWVEDRTAGVPQGLPN